MSLGVSALRRALAFARYLHATDYARKDGWWIEYEGRVVGGLVYVDGTDQFWVRYATVPSPGCASLLDAREAWTRGWFSFRSKTTHQVAEGAWAGGAEQPGYVSMRRLYLGPRTWLERLCLRFIAWGP